MKIEHVAMWTNNLEGLKDFYINYFNARANRKYVNENKKFQSYFLSFDEGCRLEIMEIPSINENSPNNEFLGLTHLAISVGSKDKVLELTHRLRKDGFRVLSEPRTTGDGYFESVIADPEGNRVEITE